MTARRSKTAAQETAVEFDFDSIEPTISDQPVIAFKPNPLKKWVQASVDQGYVTLEITVPTGNAKDAVNMLRRAALPVSKGGIDCGLKLTTDELPDGNTVIRFQAKAEKKTRSYTVDDVRTWAEENNVPKEDIYPRVKRDVSRRYRIANGLEAEKAE